MPLYGGIDLHANNSVVVLLNEQDHAIYQRRLANHLPAILEPLAPYQADITGVVVESTDNWYWLVDGLLEAGYRVHLANPAAMQQYSGLKYTDDRSDARWLAHLLRLGVNWLRVFRRQKVLAAVIGATNRSTRERGGQKNAWHARTDVGRECA
jgi:transposase